MSVREDDGVLGLTVPRLGVVAIDRASGVALCAAAGFGV